MSMCCCSAAKVKGVEEVMAVDAFYCVLGCFCTVSMYRRSTHGLKTVLVLDRKSVV